jgi:hypothetical protein
MVKNIQSAEVKDSRADHEYATTEMRMDEGILLQI